jgi:hypothetical protein
MTPLGKFHISYMWVPHLSLSPDLLSLPRYLLPPKCLLPIPSTIPPSPPILTAAVLFSCFPSRTRPQRNPHPRFSTGEAPSHHHPSLIRSVRRGADAPLRRQRRYHRIPCAPPPEPGRHASSASCSRPPCELRLLRAASRLPLRVASAA